MINGEKIKKKMIDKCIAQKDMAHEVGISQSMMTYIIQGLREPSTTVLVRIAKKLECTVDELIVQ